MLRIFSFGVMCVMICTLVHAEFAVYNEVHYTIDAVRQTAEVADNTKSVAVSSPESKLRLPDEITVGRHSVKAASKISLFTYL